MHAVLSNAWDVGLYGSDNSQIIDKPKYKGVFDEFFERVN